MDVGFDFRRIALERIAEAAGRGPQHRVDVARALREVLLAKLQRLRFAAILISLRLHDITNGHNTDQFSLVHNRQMTHTHFGHGIGHRHQVILWYRGDDLSGHHRTHRLGKYRFVHGCRPNDVAFSEEPDQLSSVIQDNESTDIVPDKQDECLTNCLFRTDRNHVGTLSG